MFAISLRPKRWGATSVRDRLYEEALTMSVNKNLLDVTTLLEFAHSTENVLEKARHIDQAVELLRDVRAQLIHLGAPDRR